MPSTKQFARHLTSGFVAVRRPHALQFPIRNRRYGSQIREHREKRYNSYVLDTALPDTATQRASSRSVPGWYLLLPLILIGSLLSLPASLVLVWNDDRPILYERASSYYVAILIGFLGALPIARWSDRIGGARLSWLTGFWVSAAAHLILCLTISIPSTLFGRYLGLVGIGAALALLLHGAATAWAGLCEHDSPSASYLAASCIGIGAALPPCLLVAFGLTRSAVAILAFTGLVPVGLWAFLRARQPAALSASKEELGTAPGALLYVLLFLQAGCEWGLAGWLPVLMTQRLALTPERGLLSLGYYLLLLALARLWWAAHLAQGRWRSTLAAALAAVFFGSVLLTMTNSPVIAILGISLTAVGFAPLLSLIVLIQGLDRRTFRLDAFRPHLLFAAVGGLIACVLIGSLAQRNGIRVMMLPPLFTNWLILALLVILGLERWLSEVKRIRVKVR